MLQMYLTSSIAKYFMTSSLRWTNPALSVWLCCFWSQLADHTGPSHHPDTVFTCHHRVWVSAGEAKQLEQPALPFSWSGGMCSESSSKWEQNSSEAKCLCWFQHPSSKHNKLCIPSPPSGFPDTHTFSGCRRFACVCAAELLSWSGCWFCEGKETVETDSQNHCGGTEHSCADSAILSLKFPQKWPKYRNMTSNAK